LDIVFGYFASKIHHSNGDNFRLPLQAKRRFERIVDEVPSFLHDFFWRRSAALQALRVLDEKSIGMVDLQIKFDGFQEYPLHCDHFLLGILAK
jgi:hypothetical protein